VHVAVFATPRPPFIPYAYSNVLTLFTKTSRPIDPEAVQEHKLTNIEFKNINLKSNYWDVETLFPRFDLMMIYSEL
jgi:hypothetical protein